MVSPELLAAARGDVPADLVFRDARLVNVFSGEIERTDVAVFAGRVAGIGPSYRGREDVALGGAYLAPGLIDAHVHIESSLCTPPAFAAAVMPRGVTTVVADPHEIANVAGVAGVRFMADSSRGLPLGVILMAPSCVPATPLATAGATLTAADLAALLADGTVHGLAEFMNYPGVIAGAADARAKLDAFAGRPIDGHAPGVSGRALNAYAAAGVRTDHECVTPAEAAERLARGMYVLIREATNARNLDALLTVVTPANGRRVCFCTDDRVPGDLLTAGGIDDMVRRAIAAGVAPVEAIRMATLNTAECYGLHDRGGVAPGRRADLFVFDDPAAPRARAVYAGGRLVARDGAMSAGAIPHCPPPAAPLGRCEVRWDAVDLRVPAGRDNDSSDNANGGDARATGVNASDVPATGDSASSVSAVGARATSVPPTDDNATSVAATGDDASNVSAGGGANVGGGGGGGVLRVRVIGAVPDQLVTEARVMPAKVDDGLVVADVSRDVLKMAVIDRHGHGGPGGKGGRCGVGFITGFGLRRGAIAGTVAHDHHNLVIIGADDASMLAAARAVVTGGGGLAAADGAMILAQLPLPIAGLMSDRPIEDVRAAYDRLVAAARELGATPHDPFMAMSFMALEVIPALKLTDLGLVDVTTFGFVDLLV